MISMNDIIDKTMQSLSEEYDKLSIEQQTTIKKLEELAAKYQVLQEIKDELDKSKLGNDFTSGNIIAGETIKVKEKSK